MERDEGRGTRGEGKGLELVRPRALDFSLVPLPCRCRRDAPATMDPAVAKVRRHGLCGYFSHLHGGERVGIEFETVQVGREQHLAAGCQQSKATAHERNVIALHVEHALHALGIGKAWRIEHDQAVSVPRCALLLKKTQDISPHQTIAPGFESIEFEVAPCPVQIGFRQIDAGRGSGPASRCVNAETARVAEQVQDVPSGGKPADQCPCFSMIQEQTGIEMIEEIDDEAMPSFAHHEIVRAGRQPAILVYWALSGALLEYDGWQWLAKTSRGCLVHGCKPASLRRRIQDRKS